MMKFGDEQNLKYEVLNKMNDIVLGEAYAHDFCSLTRTKRQNMFMMYERLNMMPTNNLLEKYDDTTPTMLEKKGRFEFYCHRDLLRPYLTNNYSEKEILECFEHFRLVIYKTILKSIFDVPENWEGTDKQFSRIVWRKTKTALQEKLSRIVKQKVVA